MKRTMKFPLYAAMAAFLTLSSTSCSDDPNPTNTDNQLSEKEAVLQKAATDFVNKTVIPTYKGMADASMRLQEACEEIQKQFAANQTIDAQLVEKAGNEWIEARKYWELSEAFLYGAAGDYNIDPHIDSWPLDKQKLNELLANRTAMEQMNADYAANYLGYGLLGFHALEYMLFENTDGEGGILLNTTDQEKLNNYLKYTVAVAGDLNNQCIRLEASWAGMDNITEEKQNILTDAELEPSMNYGESMINAGQAGSKYKNYLETAQEIIQGCVDIADEVGKQKIGRPAGVTTEGNVYDTDYIESPYSENSKTDFIDNIKSIQNAYLGSNEGDASVSDYVKTVSPETNEEVVAAINNAIAKIEAIPGVFRKNYNTQEAKDAAEACGTTLVNALNKAIRALEE